MVVVLAVERLVATVVLANEVTAAAAGVEVVVVVVVVVASLKDCRPTLDRFMVDHVI